MSTYKAPMQHMGNDSDIFIEIKHKNGRYAYQVLVGFQSHHALKLMGLILGIWRAELTHRWPGDAYMRQ